MSTKSPGPQRCRLILQQCLAIQLSKAGNAPEDFWMYDSGYMIFQVSIPQNSNQFMQIKRLSSARRLLDLNHDIISTAENNCRRANECHCISTIDPDGKLDFENEAESSTLHIEVL